MKYLRWLLVYNCFKCSSWTTRIFNESKFKIIKLILLLLLLLKKVLITKEYNKQGIYYVRLCKGKNKKQ